MLNCFEDSDFAGGLDTRESTSGGIMCLGDRAFLDILGMFLGYVLDMFGIFLGYFCYFLIFWGYFSICFEYLLDSFFNSFWIWF